METDTRANVKMEVEVLQKWHRMSVYGAIAYPSKDI